MDGQPGGNGSLLIKLMTAKFPGCALLMELACFMKKRSMKVLVDWTPREGSKEADQLANGVVKNFSPELEIKLDPSLIQWEILPDALRMAREADTECKELKTTRSASKAGPEEEKEETRREAAATRPLVMALCVLLTLRLSPPCFIPYNPLQLRGCPFVWVTYAVLSSIAPHCPCLCYPRLFWIGGIRLMYFGLRFLERV